MQRANHATRRCYLVRVILGILAAAWPVSPLAEAAPPPLEIVGQYGGASYAVEIAGNRAYLGVGPRVVIFDISDPSNLQILGRTPVLPYTVEAIAVAGNYAYIIAGEKGLVIVDISDPASPKMIGSVAFSSFAVDVAVSGAYAYVAAASAGLQVVDVSDPASPVVVGSHYSVGSAGGVAVSGNYAYVTNGDDAGLEVIDVSNPASPTLVGGFDPSGYTYDATVSGTYLYLVSLLGGFDVLDISDPTSPTWVGGHQLNAFNAIGVTVAGPYAYVASWDVGLEIVDISNPASPVGVGVYDTSGGAVTVAIAGSHAYVADDSAGMVVIDVSNPAAPVKASEYEANVYAFGVTVAGNYAYLADGYYDNGLQVIDISDPSAPTRVGKYPPTIFNTDGYDYHVPMAVSGHHLFMPAQVSGFRIMDISNPTAPTLVRSFLDDKGISGLAAEGDYVYVLALFPDSALGVVDVSNPQSPVLVGTVNLDQGMGSAAYDLAVSNHHAYVADAAAGFQIIDVSNPAAPTRVAGYPTTDFSRAAAAFGDFAYVDEYGIGIHAFNVTDPSSPVHVGLYSEQYGALALAAGANLLYRAAWSTVDALDTSGHADPVLLGSYSGRGAANSVAVAGDYACVAENWGGLAIVRVASAPPSTPFALDIKPGSCPNPFNNKSRGQLPVAIVSSAQADAAAIDASTVRLARADGVGGSVAPTDGPLGPHPVLEDVATPFIGEACRCHTRGADGLPDLMLHFKRPDMVHTLRLDELPAGADVPLVISGMLTTGESFTATDCIRLVPPVDSDEDADGIYALEDACANTPAGAQVDGIGCSGPILIAATSRRTHGTAGDFDINLPLFGTPAIEPRQNGVAPRIVLTFDHAIEAVDGSVDCGQEITILNGKCVSAAVESSSLIVGVNLEKDRCVSVTLSGLRGAGGGVPMTGDNDVQVLTQEGNANLAGGVNVLDLQAIRNRLNQPVDSGTFLYDVTASGAINILDLTAAKGNLNQPAVCP